MRHTVEKVREFSYVILEEEQRLRHHRVNNNTFDNFEGRQIQQQRQPQLTTTAY